MAGAARAVAPRKARIVGMLNCMVVKFEVKNRLDRVKNKWIVGVEDFCCEDLNLAWRVEVFILMESTLVDMNSITTVSKRSIFLTLSSDSDGEVLDNGSRISLWRLYSAHTRHAHGPEGIHADVSDGMMQRLCFALRRKFSRVVLRTTLKQAGRASAVQSSALDVKAAPTKLYQLLDWTLRINMDDHWYVPQTHAEVG
jgi:hypothetical protein